MKNFKSIALAVVSLACFSVPGAARYYDPATGRFLSEDPIFRPGRSSYEYALNNPLRYTDPLGLDAVLVSYGGYHDVVWVGPDAGGNYLGYGLQPNYGYAGAGWSLLSGQDIGGYIQREGPTRGTFGGSVLARKKQNFIQDKLLITELQRQMKSPQTYNTRLRNCQQWAGPYVYGNP